MQSGARSILRGQFEFHVLRADFPQPIQHDLLGEFGAIALAAEMAQIRAKPARSLR